MRPGPALKPALSERFLPPLDERALDRLLDRRVIFEVEQFGRLWSIVWLVSVLCLSWVWRERYSHVGMFEEQILNYYAIVRPEKNVPTHGLRFQATQFIRDCQHIFSVNAN